MHASFLFLTLHTCFLSRHTRFLSTDPRQIVWVGLYLIDSSSLQEQGEFVLRTGDG
jgi:putative methionine-R-sulfoxide reductase with GAF domain